MTELTALSTEPLLVGVSVSEPSNEELTQLGLSEMHVRHAFIEIVRHMLARGWSVAYGGDLRTAGYTESMFDLVRTYDRKDLSGPDRVMAYLAWPIWQALTDEQRAELTNVATLREIAAPPGAPATLPQIEARQTADRLWGSLALTKMREEMTSQLGARVVLGGRLSGQQGLYPGVAEEAALSLRAGVPLFVSGGFGGCGRAITVALRETTPVELTVDYQIDHTPHYAGLLDAYESANLEEASLESLVATLRDAGVQGLANGLNESENVRLFESDDVDEIVALILHGLRQLTDDK